VTPCASSRWVSARAQSEGAADACAGKRARADPAVYDRPDRRHKVGSRVGGRLFQKRRKDERMVRIAIPHRRVQDRGVEHDTGCGGREFDGRFEKAQEWPLVARRVSSEPHKLGARRYVQVRPTRRFRFLPKVSKSFRTLPQGFPNVSEIFPNVSIFSAENQGLPRP
jgi:hypothetical protein